MSKFFVEPSKVGNNEIIIDTDDVNHILRVLRMNVGSELIVCDTQGWDYVAEIKEIKQKSLICSIKSKEKCVTEPDLKVVLYQALPKGTKMEYIIQKTTELGISRIVPVAMSRCVVKIDKEADGIKKAERWQKIAESAAKQSGRGIVPEVSKPISFNDAVSGLKSCDTAFVPYECEEKHSIKDEISGSVKGDMTVGVIIGPEGGFSPEEIIKLNDAGITSVALGRRILRTETAGEAVLTMLMYEADEF